MRVAVASDSGNGSKAAFNEIHPVLNVFRVRLLQRRFVEIPLVKPSSVNVEGFLVNLGGVQSGGQHQRCVHLAASVGR